MEIQLQTQDEMIEMADYFLSDSESESMNDFDKYCHSRDLLKTWNQLPVDKRIEKSHQIEIYGFNVKTPVWK